jgi:hypothetical protein
MAKRAAGWPESSPGAVNAWLVMLTTKSPTWRDALVQWAELPPTLGAPHEGFFYPDPLGFWSEVRRWSLELFHLFEPEWDVAAALSLSALLHLADDRGRVQWILDVCQPVVVLFLDDAAWTSSGLDAARVPHYIADPHRTTQVYEGFWGTTPDGLVIGKAPQHPTTHRLYRAEDMTGFLQSVPRRPEHTGATRSSP